MLWRRVNLSISSCAAHLYCHIDVCGLLALGLLESGRWWGLGCIWGTVWWIFIRYGNRKIICKHRVTFAYKISFKKHVRKWNWSLFYLSEDCYLPLKTFGSDVIKYVWLFGLCRNLCIIRTDSFFAFFRHIRTHWFSPIWAIFGRTPLLYIFAIFEPTDFLMFFTSSI